MKPLKYTLAVIVLTVFSGVPYGMGQSLRFSNYREVAVPEYATVRIGPFYSTLRYTQSLGYRYTVSSGAGTDYLFGTRRGRIRSDGSEFPVTSILDSRNYLLITRWMDLDMSVRASYRHYPRGTQDDDFRIDFTDEGVFGLFSAEYRLSEHLRGRIYDNFVYRTDYIDARGLVDDQGGSQYEHIQNVLGTDLDWLPRPAHNVGLSLSRTDLIPRDDEFENQERVSYNERLKYQWQVNAWLVAGAGGAWNQNYYAVDTRPDSLSQTYDVNAQVRVTENTSGFASAGYSLTSVAENEEDDSWRGSAVGAVSLNTDLTPSFSHDYGYSRSQTIGFISAFERQDSLHYNLNYSGFWFSGRLSTRHTSAKPSSPQINGYSDWVTMLQLNKPVGDVSSFSLSLSYALRDNETAALSDEDAEVDLSNDYATFTALARFSTQITRKITGDVYTEHIERFSDEDSLSYRRLNAGANVTYVHQF